MFGFDDAQDNYNQAYNDDHQAKLSHEVLAGGASFMAMKMFEDKQRREGVPVSHAFAKEMLAGFAGGEVDRLAETKGADWIDRERAKRDARRQAEDLYDQHYGQQGNQFDPNQMAPPRHIEQSFGGGQGGGQGGGFGGQRGFDQGGYGGQGGFDQGGYGQQGGFDQGGYGQQGRFDQGGYGQQGGFDQGGYGQGGYDQGGYQQGGRW